MGPRVLVVDDGLEMAETLAEALSDNGYETLACGSSTQAARQLETNPYASGPLAMTSCTRGSTMVDPPRAGAFAKPACTLQETMTLEMQRQVALHPINPTMANSPISTRVSCRPGAHFRRIGFSSLARLRAIAAPRFPAIEASAR